MIVFERIQSSPVDLVENKIRDAFIRDFEQENLLLKTKLQQQTLILTWERWLNTPEDQKSRADICFSMSGLEFVIECKRLESADNQYIEEGVQRFINLKYAEKDEFAGMIGFIISGNPSQIVRNLKEKVRDCSPSESMDLLLEQKCIGHELSFQSSHKRLNDKDIHLYHLFFSF